MVAARNRYYAFTTAYRVATIGSRYYHWLLAGPNREIAQGQASRFILHPFERLL
jgi:hypothetical protein